MGLAVGKPTGDGGADCRSFAGVEIMRRLVGGAQLPLGYGIDDKTRLLALARDLVLAP